MNQSFRYGLILFCATIAAGSVAQTNVAPYIISEPQDQAVNPCDSVTFTVIAGGSEPLSYQWEVRGNLTGCTTNVSFTEGWVQRVYNGGHYSVTITNSWGSVTSRQALLTVPIVPCVDRPAGYYWPVMGYLASVWPPTNWVCSFAGLPNGSAVWKQDPQGTGPISYDGFIGFYRVRFGSGWSPYQPSPPPPGFGWLVYLSS